MTTAISIIGKGKMGQALARHFEQAGISVQILGREQEVVQGKFVVFAVPYEDMISLIYPNQEHFTDKIIIDISNPLDYKTKKSLLALDESVSLKLASQFPDLTFIKAFNTTFTSSRVIATESPLIMIAGDSSSAKEKLITLLNQSHFETIDMGNLDRSRDLEAFARVQLSLLEAGHIKPLKSFAL